MTTDTVGGVWTYSLDLTRALRAAGVDVVLATMGAPLRDDQRRDAAAAGPAALYESEFALEWMTSPWQEVDAAGEWLLEIARNESVDVVHSSSYAHGTLEWGRPVVVVGHSCVVSWWRAVDGTDPPPEWDVYRARVQAGLTAADAVVAPTAAMLRELQQAYGLTAGAVIPNGTSTAETHADREAFVLAAGRMWDRAKGLDLLDAAATRLAWPVLVAGDRGQAQHVRALGQLAPDELAAIRARAAVFAAPARYEPFGLAILEAARAGCALVLGDIPSLRELWSEAALFVDTADSAALCGALERLAGDEQERARLGRAARMRARRYSLDRMARRYVQLYDRLHGAARPQIGVAA